MIGLIKIPIFRQCKLTYATSKDILKCPSGKLHEKNVNYDLLMMILFYCF